MAKNINIQGLDKLLSGLDKASKDFQQEVKEIIEMNLGDIEMEAIRNAPGPSDEIQTEYGSENERDIVNGRGWTPISQAITYEVYPNGYGGRVIVNNSAGPISIWVEMGTGQSANSYLLTVPLDWADYARKFYLTGRGTILDRPYLLPAYDKYSIKTIRDIKDAMKNIKL